MSRPHLFDQDLLCAAYGCYNPPDNVYAGWRGLVHTGQRHLTPAELAAQSGPCVTVVPARSRPRRHTPGRMAAQSGHPDHARGRRARELLTTELLVEWRGQGLTLAQAAERATEIVGLPVHLSLISRIATERGLSWLQRRRA